MPDKTDWEAAFAICAAIIGAGFASGREIVGFFSGLGHASWLGVAAASAGIAGLTYMIIRLVGRTGSDGFPELYGSLMGQPCQDAVDLLHGLLCLITASAMLAAGAELGALVFPCRYSHGIGFTLTLCAAILATLSGFRSLALLGAVLIPLIACFYLQMGLNGRYAPPFDAAWLPVALPMGLLYAAFNATLAGSAVCTAGKRGASAKATAILTGGMMFILLVLANAAMLRAGDTVRQMALPAVALASHGGLIGFYASVIVMWLSVLTTLCAMLHALLSRTKHARIPRSASLLLVTAAASMPAVCGFCLLVDTLYPILGWVCSFTLLALVFFLPENDTNRESGSSSAPE